MATPPSAQSLETENPVLVRVTCGTYKRTLAHTRFVPRAPCVIRQLQPAAVPSPCAASHCCCTHAPACPGSLPPGGGAGHRRRGVLNSAVCAARLLCARAAGHCRGASNATPRCTRPCATCTQLNGCVCHHQRRADAVVSFLFLHSAPRCKAELHFKAAGSEDWAPLLLFLGGLALVVFAVRPPHCPAHTTPHVLLRRRLPVLYPLYRPWSTPACNTSPPRRLPTRRSASSGTAKRCSAAGCTPHRRPDTAPPRLLRACMTWQHTRHGACPSTAPWASSLARSTARR